MNFSNQTRSILMSSCSGLALAMIVTIPAGATTYTVPTATTQTVATQIVGTDNVLLTGGGTLVLSNATNTYTGGTQVIGGSILQITADGNLGGAAGGLTLGDGATVGTLTFGGATMLVATRSMVLNAGTQTVNTGTFTDTIAAIISGAGALTKTGTGTLILTGANTYAGTTTISGGTLQIGNTAVASSVFDTTAWINSASIVNNGTLIFNRGDGNVAATPSITYAGLISGSGAVKQLGYGTVIFTANNTYTGVTTITGSNVTVAGVSTAYGATLQLGNAGTTGWIGSSSVVTGTNGTLAFNRSDNVTWGGVISGTGNISQLGTGVLTITGANSFTGTTTIAAGTGGVVVTGAGTLGTNAVVNNAVLDISGITASSLTIKSLATSAATTTIASPASVILGSKTLITTSGATWGGVISGTGGVTINGGTEIFTAANTFTGTVTIGSGATLQLGSATFAGSVGGKTFVDNGTLSISRTSVTDLTGYSITGTGAFKQVASGTTILNGAYGYTGLTTVSAGNLYLGDGVSTSGSLGGGLTVSGGTLLGQGSVAGAFTVSGGTAKLNGDLTAASYTQNGGALSVHLTPTGASLLTVSGTAKLGGTLTAYADATFDKVGIFPILKAGSITGSFATTAGVAGKVVYQLYSQTSTEVDLVAMPLSQGQVYGALATTGLFAVNQLNNVAFEHSAHDGCESTAANKSKDCQGFSVWTEGLGGTNHTDAGNSANAFNSHTGGLLFGAGYRFHEEGALNIAFGLSHTALAINGLNQTAETGSRFISVNGHASGDIALDAGAFYAANTSTVTRDTGIGTSAVSHSKSTVSGGNLQVSLPLLSGDVAPFARVSYAFLTYGPFVENGGGLLNLQGQHGIVQSGRYDAGIRLSHSFKTSEGIILQPMLSGAFEDDGGAGAPEVAMALANNASLTAFVAPSQSRERYAGVVRAGLDAKLDDAWNVRVNLNGRFNRTEKELYFDFGASYHL